jgi:hypothetical protein
MRRFKGPHHEKPTKNDSASWRRMDRGVVRRIESAGELSCHHQMVERGPKSQMANLLVVLDVGRGGEARASQKVFM